MHYNFAHSVCCYQLRRMQIIRVCKWKCQSYIKMKNGWSLLKNKSQNYDFFAIVLEAIVGDGKNGKQITRQRLNNCARTFTAAKHKTNEMKTKSFVFFPLALASAERRLQRISCMNKILRASKRKKKSFIQKWTLINEWRNVLYSSASKQTWIKFFVATKRHRLEAEKLMKAHFVSTFWMSAFML